MRMTATTEQPKGAEHFRSSLSGADLMQNLKLSHHRKILVLRVKGFQGSSRVTSAGPSGGRDWSRQHLADVLSATQSCLCSGETEVRAELWGLQEGTEALLFQQIF